MHYMTGRLRMLLTLLSLALVMALSACQSGPAVSGQSGAQYNPSVRDYDGHYNITFISQGKLMAVADVEIDNAKVMGTVVNVLNQTFKVQGMALSSGALFFTNIESSLGQKVSADGIVAANGTVEGNYQVGDRTGRYFGFRYVMNESPSTLYDGLYHLKFEINGQQTAAADVEIKDGAFKKDIKTHTGEIFAIQGRISQEGRILLTTAIGDAATGIAASGAINADGSITGIFYMQDGVKGNFAGAPIK